MDTLRWILLGIGILILSGTYLWGIHRFRQSPIGRAQEPEFGAGMGSSDWDDDDVLIRPIGKVTGKISSTHNAAIDWTDDVRPVCRDSWTTGAEVTDSASHLCEPLLREPRDAMKSNQATATRPAFLKEDRMSQDNSLKLSALSADDQEWIDDTPPLCLVSKSSVERNGKDAAVFENRPPRLDPLPEGGVKLNREPFIRRPVSLGPKLRPALQTNSTKATVFTRLLTEREEAPLLRLKPIGSQGQAKMPIKRLVAESETEEEDLPRGQSADPVLEKSAGEQPIRERARWIDQIPAGLKNLAIKTKKEPEESVPIVVQPDQVLIIHLQPATPGHLLMGKDLLSAFSECGLEYGNMQIFHHVNEEGEALFSLANMVKPGIFDRQHRTELETLGVSLFLQLAEVERPMEAFRSMLECAHCLSVCLHGKLLDEYHNPMTRQTLTHYEKRVRDYIRRHTHRIRGKH